MPIIHVFGASGAGTSSLGRELQERFGYSQMDTDDYFWLATDPPFIQKRLIEDRLERMNRDMKKSDHVVISGSLCGWGDVLIPKFDLVIRLIVPTEIRLSRLKEREFKRFGERIRANGDMYDEHQKFIEWASQYDSGDRSMRSKAMHDEWQEKLTCKQMILDGTMPPEKLINEIAMNVPL